MNGFSIDGFAEACKQVMSNAKDKHQAAKEFLEQTLEENDRADIIESLEGAIPPDASIGEMIVTPHPTSLCSMRAFHPDFKVVSIITQYLPASDS